MNNNNDWQDDLDTLLANSSSDSEPTVIQQKVAPYVPPTLRNLPAYVKAPVLCACARCPKAMWYLEERPSDETRTAPEEQQTGPLYAYCQVMHRITFQARGLPTIQECDQLEFELERHMTGRNSH